MANSTMHRRLSNLQWVSFFLLVSSLQFSGVTTAGATAGEAKMESVEAECSVDGTCTSLPNNDDNASSCKDMHENCEFWAKSGECNANANYMLRNCPNACDVCSFITSGELDKEISKRLKEKQLKEEALIDLTETPYGVAQEIKSTDLDTQLKLTEVVQNMTDYMEQVVFQDEGHAKVKKECKNRNKNCALWAFGGECDANPSFMTVQCAPSCHTCHLIDFDTRCPYNASDPTILNPGDLDKLFTRLTTDEYYTVTYQATIHSMPNPPPAIPSSDGSDDAPQIKDGPWVVTLENFLTDEECDRLIELGGKLGYEISKDVGAQKFDGTFDGYVNDRRTSTNAWCTKDCFADPLTQGVLQRIENATGIPDANSEYLQLLRYEVGQFYKTHHDYIAYQRTRQQGVRILTVFLYLNDVEAGGGTDFPRLGITVAPKRGRVLIWPSVWNDDPNTKDPRTDHQALPVEKGIKFGANAWLHQRDFKTPYAKSCH